MTTQIVRIDRPVDTPVSNVPVELVPILCIKHPPPLCVNVGDALETALRGAGRDKPFTDEQHEQTNKPE